MNNLKKRSHRLHSEPQIRFTSETVDRWMEIFAENILEAKGTLTELDAAIGDGDHGVNMCRGMDAVAEMLQEVTPSDPSGQMRLISTTLTSSVGGASGPLYGAFFLQCSHASLHKPELGLADLTTAMEAGYRAVVHLGKASVGDKTMVDTLASAVRSLRASCTHFEALPEALNSCQKAGRAAATGTRPMVAKKGRASYLGERSAGVQDPGATSAALLFESLAEAVSLSSPLHSNSQKPILL